MVTQLHEIRQFSLRLKANDFAPVLEGLFCPHFIITSGPVKKPVQVIIYDRVFMVLEPETFIPQLAYGEYKKTPEGEQSTHRPLTAEELGSLKAEILELLPHRRSLATSGAPSESGLMWSFMLQGHEPFRLYTEEVEREFVLGGMQKVLLL